MNQHDLVAAFVVVSGWHGRQGAAFAAVALDVLPVAALPARGLD